MAKYPSVSSTLSPLGRISILWCTLDAKLPAGASDLIRNPDEKLLAIQAKSGLKILCAVNQLQRDELYRIICFAMGKETDCNRQRSRQPVSSRPTSTAAPESLSHEYFGYHVYEDISDVGHYQPLLLGTRDEQKEKPVLEFSTYDDSQQGTTTSDSPCGALYDDTIQKEVRRSVSYENLLPPPLPPQISPRRVGSATHREHSYQNIEQKSPRHRKTYSGHHAFPHFTYQEEEEDIGNLDLSALQIGEHSPVVERKSLVDEKQNQPPWKDRAKADDSMKNYVSIFQVDQFDMKPKEVSVSKDSLNEFFLRLATVGDEICIIYLDEAVFPEFDLHLGDVVVSVNMMRLLSIKSFYRMVRKSMHDKVILHVRRSPYGEMSHVALSEEDDFKSLGLRFDNQDRGFEVTAIENGLVRKSGKPSRSKANGVVTAGKLVNWALVEINGKPVLHQQVFQISGEDVKKRLVSSGKELALLFLPIDLVEMFLCGDFYQNVVSKTSDESEESEDDPVEDREYADIADE